MTVGRFAGFMALAILAMSAELLGPGCGRIHIENRCERGGRRMPSPLCSSDGTPGYLMPALATPT